MSARTKARKRALDVLYEADLRGRDPLSVLAARVEYGNPAIPEYTVELVEGVRAHQERIDELLGTHSVGWPLERMPPVDRNLLRLGCYELLWSADVPEAVAVSEAVELARMLSTDDSAGFVNGLLARLLELKPTLAP